LNVVVSLPITTISVTQALDTLLWAYYADALSRPQSVQTSALMRFDEMSHPNMPRQKD
jgi:hypothetical protein